MANLDGDFRVRVGMMHPKNILNDVDEIIDAMKHPKVYNFIHLPIQSGSDRILKLMGRRYTKEDIKKLCDEAIKYGFASVCVNPCYVELAHDLLDGTNVSVCTVVGFPLGANKVATKEFEAIAAIEDGADEIDMVINIGALKDKDYDYVKEEIEGIDKLSM